MNTDDFRRRGTVSTRLNPPAKTGMLFWCYPNADLLRIPDEAERGLALRQGLIDMMFRGKSTRGCSVGVYGLWGGSCRLSAELLPEAKALVERSITAAQGHLLAAAHEARRTPENGGHY